VNHDRGDSIEQVEAKFPLFDKSLKVLVGGGNKPEINFPGPFSTDLFFHAVLQNAQKLCLNLNRHISDLIKKDSTLVRLFEFSLPSLFVGAGERACFVTKQFRLNKRGG